MSKDWQTIKDHEEVHVIPTNDLKEHWESQNCWCRPRIEEEGNSLPVIIHNSLDKREHAEQNPS